jgi:hypothetical protein
MTAEVTASVTITAHLPSGPVHGDLGTIAVPLSGGDPSRSQAALTVVHQRLGELLQAAGAYYCTRCAPPSPGEGESGSLD